MIDFNNSIKREGVNKIFSLPLIFVLFLIAIPIIVAGASLDSVQQTWRDRLIQPERVMDALGIVPGMIIGEAGAGDGYFTFHLSRRVGEAGFVYANDISQKALKELNQRRLRERITNISTVLGEIDDPLFPEKDLDMIILVYAFHDFEKKVEWLNNAEKYMKSDAPLVIIDRDPDKYGGEYSHFMTRRQVIETVSRTNFALDRVETFLQRENIYIFRKKQVFRTDIQSISEY